MADPAAALQAVLDQLARKCAELLASRLPRGVGFALLLFDWRDGSNGNDQGWLSWISNARRPDTRAALQGLLARWRREEAAAPPDDEVDALGQALLRAAGARIGDVLTIELARRIARVAIDLGASVDLAAADQAGAAAAPRAGRRPSTRPGRPACAR